MIALSNATANSSQVTVFGEPGFLRGKAVNWTNMDSAMAIVINSGLYPSFEVGVRWCG